MSEINLNAVNASRIYDKDVSDMKAGVDQVSSDAESAFREMLSSGSDQAVAWDRDMVNVQGDEAPRLYRKNPEVPRSNSEAQGVINMHIYDAMMHARGAGTTTIHVYTPYGRFGWYPDASDPLGGKWGPVYSKLIDR